MRRWTKTVLAAGAVLALAGCDGGVEGIHPSAPPETIDVGEARSPAPSVRPDVLEAARAAFWERGRSLVAGFETHRVEVARDDDALAVTPMHHEGGAAPEAPARFAPVDAASLVDAQRATSPIATRVAEAPFVARTAFVGREGARLDAPPAAPRAVAGHLEIDRGDVVERVDNARDGIEQSWRFAARPGGEGDLLVQVAVDGMAHVGTTARGEHFADAGSGLGVCYGHGTFIDADGVETPVPVAFRDGALELRVPAEVIDLAAYPAVLDPTIGPEIAMDTPVSGPRGGNQVEPRVASDGTSYLVLFTDGLFGDDDVRGVRVSGAGAVIGSSFTVAAEPGSNQANADVVWNGTRYIATWQDGRAGNGLWDLWTVTIASDGTVGTPRALANSVPEAEFQARLGVSGSTTLVAYTAGVDANLDIRGVRLDSAGATTGSVLLLGVGADQQTEPAVGGSSTGFLVTWENEAAGPSFSLVGSRVPQSGPTPPEVPFPIASPALPGGDVGWDGGSSYVALYLGLSGTSGRIAVYGIPIPVTGLVGSPTGVELSPAVAMHTYQNARMASVTTDSYLVAWNDLTVDGGGAVTAQTVGAVRTNAALSAISAVDPTSIGGTFTGGPWVAASSSEYYVAFTHSPLPGVQTDIRGSRVTSAGVIEAEDTLLTVNDNAQSSPVVASDGSGYLVAWRDFRGGTFATWGALVGADGAVSGSSFDLGVSTSAAATDAAWAGNQYFVVLEENDDIRAVPVSAIGVPGSSFDISTDALAEIDPHIACDYDGVGAEVGCLIAYTRFDRSADPVDADIIVRRLDRTVPSVGAAVVLGGGAGNQYDSDVAAASAQFLVAWSDDSGTNVDLFARRFDTGAAGTTFLVSNAGGTQAQASVASDGTDFLIAFADDRAGGANPVDTYLTPVSAAGIVGTSGIASGSAAADEAQPSLAFNGRYLLAYTHVEAGVAQIRVRRIATDATVVDTTPITLSTASFADLPVVAGGATSPAERWLVAYRTIAAGNARINARLVTDDLPNGETCGAGTECASGFCVDGVCCATACAGGSSDCMACSTSAGGTADGTCTAIPACGGTDAGPPDAGTDGGPAGTDAGPTGGTDAGPTGTDAGPSGTDGGPSGTDGGPSGTDGGPSATDAGPSGTDGGPSATDAGPTETDAGPTGTDGGPSGTDAGPTGGTDSGPTGGSDGGITPMVDAGTDGREDGGCGCSTPGRGATPDGPWGLALLGFGALALRRRRRG